MVQKIFITGASGFVGSRLAARLVKLNFDVHVAVRPSSNLWRLNDFREQIYVHSLDLKNQGQVDSVIRQLRPDVLFHLACYGGFADESDELQTITVNTLSTYCLLNICSKVGTSKFIYIGSSSEYGVKTQPMSENDIERPVSVYGISKLAASNLVRIHAELTKLPATILRIFSPYGMYDDERRLVPLAIKAGLLNKELHLGSGKQVRDFVYVEDLIDAFILTLKKAPLRGEIINLGFGKQHTVKEVVDIIMNECGCSVSPLWGALLDRENEPTMWQSDNAKAKEILGWQPRTDLLSGLKATVAWTAEQIAREAL